MVVGRDVSLTYLSTLLLPGCAISWPVQLSPAGLRRCPHGFVPQGNFQKRICPGGQDWPAFWCPGSGNVPIPSCCCGRRTVVKEGALRVRGAWETDLGSQEVFRRDSPRRHGARVQGVTPF